MVLTNVYEICVQRTCASVWYIFAIFCTAAGTFCMLSSDSNQLTLMLLWTVKNLFFYFK